MTRNIGHLAVALLVSFALAGTASAAAIVLVVPPEAPPYLVDGSQTGVNVLAAFIQGGGATFALGFTSLDPGWATIVVNPEFAVEFGPASSYLTETLSTDGGIPATVNFYAFSGCTMPSGCPASQLTDAYTVSFNADGGYTGYVALPAGNLTNENAVTTPEPTSGMIGGGGILLGIGLAFWRRWRTANR